MGVPIQVDLDRLGSTGVSQLLTAKALSTLNGCRFGAVIGNGATMLAPVTAIPTTTATMALYNGSSARSYLIDRIGAVLASGTPGIGSALIACVTAIAQARPTLGAGNNGGYAGVIMNCLNGDGAPGNSEGVFINAITLTGPQPAWLPFAGNPDGTATANIATHILIAEVDGGIVVPPGHMLGLAVLSATGTNPLFSFSVVWDEIELQ